MPLTTRSLTRFLRLLAVGAVSLAMATVFTTSADAVTPMTATAAPAFVLAGQHAHISGHTGTHPKRVVRLQRKSGDVWHTISTVKSALGGKYTLTDPTSRTGQYRTVAPRVHTGGHTYVRRVAAVGINRWQATLASGARLLPGYALVSPSGKYTLAMQTDGNLVEYGPAGVVWNAGLGSPGSTLTMQTDGNLVVYQANGTAAWGSATDTFPGAYVTVQDDGNLVIYQGGRALWTPSSGRLFDQLFPGQSLGVNQTLRSTDHRFVVVMQGDGNLVEYQGPTALWSTRTNGNTGATAIMQTDGNLVIYKPGGVAIWDSHTAGKPGTRLVLQNDANLVVYQGGTAVWSRGTPGGGCGGNTGGVIGDDYPANLKSAGVDAVFNPWGFYNRECTSFVAWRLNHQNGYAFSNGMRGGHFGDASNWAANARSLGYAVNSTPAVGAVATRASGDHVAWVAAVGPGTVTVEQYNRHLDEVYTSETVPTSLFVYIHVHDIG